jgi:ribosome biogenesis protein
MTIGNNNVDDVAEKIRVHFILDSTVTDSSLCIPSVPIAVPSTLRRKGLSAIVNHLLERKAEDESTEVSEDDEEERKLPGIVFDFMISGKLLRTGVETAARRFGLSLEESIEIIYFPAQQQPQAKGRSEKLPDWISCLSLSNNSLFSAGYDGVLRVHQLNDDFTTVTSLKVHTGPIKCMASCAVDNHETWIATGSIDHSLKINKLVENVIHVHGTCQEGHTSTIGCVDLLGKDQCLISGDWDGKLCIWNTRNSESKSSLETTAKKSRSKSGESEVTQSVFFSSANIAAHNSNISGVSWAHDGNHVVTGSWDHSVKVWNLESQDCLLTLNGARVVSCLDRNPNSMDVLATGHPDCTIRLWDIRTNEAAAETSLVSDSTLKPSHKAWVSSVRWSPKNPFVLSSTSHDGTLKLWDIRSSLPLYTVRAHGVGEKSLCSVHGDDVIYSAGTDCSIKHYRC